MACSERPTRPRAELGLDIRPPAFHHINAAALEKALCTSAYVTRWHMGKGTPKHK